MIDKDLYFINFTGELNNGNNTLLNYSEDFNIIELNESDDEEQNHIEQLMILI